MPQFDSTPTAGAVALVIAELAASEAQLDDEVVATTQMLEAYRVAYLEAVRVLAVVTQDRDRAQRTIEHLRDELRRYSTAATLGRAA